MELKTLFNLYRYNLSRMNHNNWTLKNLESTKDWAFHSCGLKAYPENLENQCTLRVIWFESSLKNNELVDRRDSDYAKGTVLYIFSELDNELASGKNEFGKSVRLVCPER
jgi:hypothetical protein